MATGIKMGASSNGSRALAARPREKEPDPRTPDGQWALWLRARMEQAGVGHVELIEATGCNRSTVFKWLRGDTVPHLSLWRIIAQALGLADWYDLVPPADFVAGLSRKRRRK